METLGCNSLFFELEISFHFKRVAQQDRWQPNHLQSLDKRPSNWMK
jgi:hypothetical protein